MLKSEVGLCNFSAELSLPLMSTHIYFCEINYVDGGKMIEITFNIC